MKHRIKDKQKTGMHGFIFIITEDYPTKSTNPWFLWYIIIVKSSCLAMLVFRNAHQLTNWGEVTHICVRILTIIVSDNGLSPGRRRAIIATNAAMLLIGHSWSNFSEMWIEIHSFSFNEFNDLIYVEINLQTWIVDSISVFCFLIELACLNLLPWLFEWTFFTLSVTMWLWLDGKRICTLFMHIPYFVIGI